MKPRDLPAEAAGDQAEETMRLRERVAELEHRGADSSPTAGVGSGFFPETTPSPGSQPVNQFATPKNPPFGRPRPRFAQ